MSTPHLSRKSLKACIRHFTWAWHTVVMGTGVVGSLLWEPMLQHPTQSLFIGALPMGAATLINTALTINQHYSFAGPGFLYTLWAFWWLDCAVSVFIAVGMIFVMMTKQQHSMGEMSGLWLLPVVTLIVASSTGGVLGTALADHATPHAMCAASLTTAVSFSLVLIGLSFAMMIITVYLMRLVVYGPLDPGLVLSSFIILGPLGQGGFSVLVNGQNTTHVALPVPLSPAVIQTICLCAAWTMWSIALIWLFIALCSVGSVLRRQSISFSIATWGTIFPNGAFALLTVELGDVLESRALLSRSNFLCIGSAAVDLCLAKTIPAIWNTSIFSSPCVSKLDEQMLLALQIQDAASDISHIV
ncbi:voltage-dependent anion channel-domain-containing protein [Mycena olivaceomarginata]|nr:voltage-dependent anion channel-domain-containing protein [Mycena olivaceomarginata]